LQDSNGQWISLGNNIAYAAQILSDLGGTTRGVDLSFLPGDLGAQVRGVESLNRVVRSLATNFQDVSQAAGRSALIIGRIRFFGARLERDRTRLEQYQAQLDALTSRRGTGRQPVVDFGSEIVILRDMSRLIREMIEDSQRRGAAARAVVNDRSREYAEIERNRRVLVETTREEARLRNLLRSTNADLRQREQLFRTLAGTVPNVQVPQGPIRFSMEIRRDERQRLEREIEQIRDRIGQLLTQRGAAGLGAGILDSFGPVSSRDFIDAIDRQLETARGRIRGLQVRIDAILASGVDVDIQTLLNAAGPFNVFTNVLANLETLDNDITQALQQSFRSFDFEPIARMMGSRLNANLQSGIIDGMRSAFIRALALPGIRELGRQLGTLFAQPARTQREVAERTRRINFLLGEVRDRVRQQIPVIQQARQLWTQVAQALRPLQNEIQQTTDGAIQFGEAGSRSARGYANSLSSLQTMLQTVDSTQQGFVRSIINLREARGQVLGVDLATASLEQRLSVAGDLYRRLSNQRVDPQIISALRREMDNLNSQINQANRNQRQVGQNINTSNVVTQTQQVTRAFDLLGTTLGNVGNQISNIIGQSINVNVNTSGVQDFSNAVNSASDQVQNLTGRTRLFQSSIPETESNLLQRLTPQRVPQAPLPPPTQPLPNVQQPTPQLVPDVAPASINNITQQIKDSVSNVPASITPYVDTNKISTDVSQFFATNAFPMNLNIDFDTLKTNATDLVNTLNSDITIQDTMDQTNTKIQQVIDKARELVQVLNNVAVSVSTNVEDETTRETSMTFEFGSTTINLEGVANGTISDNDRDEILRRVGEQFDEKLEEIRTSLDSLITTAV